MSRLSAKSRRKNGLVDVKFDINETRNHSGTQAVAAARRTLESAADFARGGGPAAPDHDATNASRSDRIKAEQSRLIQWAKENGKIGSSRHLVFTRGGEHEVYYQKRTQRYIKANRLDRHKGYGIALGSFTHGATPSEYLDRLALQNTVFNDDIRLERVVENNGVPIIITSQPFIKGLSPTQESLNLLMRGKGYENLTEGAYYDEHGGLLVFDLFPRNAILAVDGFIYPIDPVIQRPGFCPVPSREPQHHQYCSLTQGLSCPVAKHDNALMLNS